MYSVRGYNIHYYYYFMFSLFFIIFNINCIPCEYKINYIYMVMLIMSIDVCINCITQPVTSTKFEET